MATAENPEQRIIPPGPGTPNCSFNMQKPPQVTGGAAATLHLSGVQWIQKACDDVILSDTVSGKWTSVCQSHLQGELQQQLR